MVSFRSCMIWFFSGGGSFSISCSGLGSWIRGTNMSIVGCKVVKCFSTCTTSESALDEACVVCLEMAIKVTLRLKPFITTRALIRYLPSMNALVSDKMIGMSKRFTTGVAMMFFASMFLGWWLTLTYLNILQLGIT